MEKRFHDLDEMLTADGWALNYFNTLPVYIRTKLRQHHFTMHTADELRRNAEQLLQQQPPSESASN